MQQASEAFKHQSSLSHQVSLAEQYNHSTPETSTHPLTANISGMVNSITAAPLQPRSVHGISDPTNWSTHHIASVQASGRLIKLSGLVNNFKAVMMVDSGSTGDFISDAYVSIHKLPCKSYET